MSPNISKLRSPNDLELLFYRDLLAPLQAYAASRWTDPSQLEAVKLLRQRFRREIKRYGYVLTESGVMVEIEPDILDMTLDAAQQTMIMLDMQILNRLIQKL
jgi:hypothetical protein